VDDNRFLVIERDGGQGATAVIKRIYLADKRDRNHDGVMDKTLLVDLMNIANPRRLGGSAPPSLSRSRQSRTWQSSTTTK
jgi:hypothetical protein